MELDPASRTGRPYVYVLYAYDKDPNSAAFPRRGDECPSPPGAMEDGCVVTGRLSRLSGGFEQVLIEDWCQQYSSHSLGSLAFGADGVLYASAGEGANYNIADWGQDGFRAIRGDPPAVVGGAQTPPSAEGGALRAQDVLTPGDPTGLGGTVVRVWTRHGQPAAGQPGHGDANARRIVAYGSRNPFRTRPARAPTRSGSGRSAGTTGRRSTASPTPPPPCAISAGRATRASGRRRELRRDRPERLRDALQRRAVRPRRPVLHLQPSVARGRRRVLRGRLVVDLRARVHAAGQQLSGPPTTARCSSPTTAATASGRCCAAPTGCRTPPTSRPSSRARRTRSSSSSGRTAISTTSTSRTAGSAASARSRPTTLPWRGVRRTGRRRPAHRELRRQRLERSRRPGDRLCLDLDGDGALTTRTAVSPTFTYTVAGTTTPVCG